MSPTALRVYLALNFRCDHDGDDAWPSHATLAVDVGCSVPTVKRALRECEGAGAVRVVQRLRADGGNTSNSYIVYRADPGFVNRGEVKNEPPGENGSEPLGGVTSDLLTRTSKELEPVELENTLPGFDQFWKFYPRRVGRRSAQKAYAAALGRADSFSIIAGLEEWVPIWAQTETKFIPHPATWLNRDGWDDEPDTATEARRETVAVVDSARRLGLLDDGDLGIRELEAGQ